VQSQVCLLSNTWQDLGVSFLFALYDSESVQGGLEIMRESWANESKLECDLRRASDRQSKSRKRANKTEQETVERRASDRQCKAKRRVKLSKRLECRASDRQCKAKRRTNETRQEIVELVS